MSEGDETNANETAGRTAGAALCLMFAAALMQGCASGPRHQVVEGPGPEARAPTPLAGGQITPPAERPVVMVIDEEGLKKAIENYRIEMKRTAGKYKHAGADLNGDGVPEAVVLFEGKDWCATTGCSLAVFRMEERGFRIVSRTVRVRGPVAASTNFTLGWRDLLVWTGGGAAPVRRVQLRFAADGYASNALLEPDVPVDSLIEGPVLIDVPPPKLPAPKKPPPVAAPTTPPAPPAPSAAVLPPSGSAPPQPIQPR